ncbi:MAG: 1-deoxy-D-xylulose-5-phosphate reductoisomerase [Clostridia bacterium]|nr:1-deoxy-D-xylulose-5-phosphate reductoisomerase [Clostridia bacterium]
MKKIAILGSTGSIGTQALDVVSQHPDRFQVSAIAANQSAERLYEQVRQFKPAIAALRTEPRDMPEDVKKGTEWFFGEDILTKIPEITDAEDVLVSVVGIVGLSAVMASLNCRKNVLLANKEPLVAGGELVIAAAKANGCNLYPVDSEHSAIFQCLEAAGPNKPVRLLLTASGGPFRTFDKPQIDCATKEQALKHPNWHMGRKITIDSATMINKALEVIEARWLFDMPAQKIDVLVHPQSVIHSMVEFQDGAVLAQLGTPDMRIPILYAMAYPERLTTGSKGVDFFSISALTFEKPDMVRFPGLRLGYDALGVGGTMPAVLNGANEVAVAAFLEDRIKFGGISRLVEEVMNEVPAQFSPGLDDVLEADRVSRAHAKTLLASGRF